MTEQRFLSCYNEYYGVSLVNIEDSWAEINGLSELYKFVNFAILYDKTPIGIDVLSIENIVLNEVLAHFNLTPEIAFAKTKKHYKCRWFISVLIWQFSDKTHEQIGETTNRDYTTVCNTIKKIRESERFAPATYRKYIEIRKMLIEKYELSIINNL